ncbi:hypothetical protein NDN08_002279 [Rhodosorus marinus]|uniref:Uncharacterized protein n=1 Tax=Rhodosorus marinus TaxID=101924 RepID=A0AAV8UTC0_9RHOD|nr:hypothetical protein NDN08_002279 [Rhodosorus marinus]
MLGFCSALGGFGARAVEGRCRMAGEKCGGFGSRRPAGCRPVSVRELTIRFSAEKTLQEEEVFDEDLDFPEEDGIVVLKDETTNKTIECIVERTVNVKDTEYYLCSPCDDPVVIAKMEGDDESENDGEAILSTLEDPESLKTLFNPAYEVLAEDGVTLQDTAYIWTVIPEPDEGFDADDDVEDEETEEEDRQSESLEWNGEEEEVDVMASFFHEGSEYFVGRTVSPVFFVTKLIDDEMRVPSQEELDEITPEIENEIEGWDYDADGDIEKVDEEEQ